VVRHEVAHRPTLDTVRARIGAVAPLHARALEEVDRALFVPAAEQERAWEDVPLELPTDDPSAAATISAPHAYMLGFGALELARGDHYLELGSGSGYGAALAAVVVGREGSVETVEFDHVLAGLTRENLAHLSLPTTVITRRADALAERDAIPRANKIWITFAVREVPAPMLAAMGEGAMLVAPVGAHRDDQRLLRYTKRGSEVVVDDFGAVRFVAARGASASR
jgi:protein-L-isoaspartate(D-aspartate) O-methyltransferase